MAVPMLRYFVIHGEAFRPRVATPALVCEWIAALAQQHHPCLEHSRLLALVAPLGVVEHLDGFSPQITVVRCPHCGQVSSVDCVFLAFVISLRCSLCGGASQARFRWLARTATAMVAELVEVTVSSP